MERLTMYREGRPVGELAVISEALYTRFRVSCDLCGEVIFRAFALGEKGEIPLGVLEPVSGRLKLERSLSRTQTESAGRLLRGEVRSGEGRPGGEWHPAGADFFQRTPFRHQMEGVEGALWRQEGGCRLLALPYSPDKEFPLTGLFCLARLREIGGRVYAVYAFDEQEFPVTR